MRPRAIVTTLVLVCGIAVMVGAQATQSGGAMASDPSPVDPALDAFIAKIRAVDNHTHVNTTFPDDSEYDALPLDALLPFPVPVRLRPESPSWLAADRTLYGYPHADLNEPHMIELRRTRERVAKEQGDRFPAWVLDRVGTEVMLANRVAMGPGLSPPRFRWVSYVDALLLPLSTKAEAAASPDRAKLYPFEEKLLRRYLADLNWTSAMGLIYSPAKLARVLEDWLIQFPEKVLFGSDAAAFGPDIGWEVAAWVGTTTTRQALGIALTDMMRNGDVSRARAEEIATMVLRTNAGKLYNLRLQ